MIDFLKRLLPGYTYPQIQAQGSLAVTRDRILQTLLLALLVLSIPTAIIGGQHEISQGKGQLAILYASFVLAVLIITTNRTWPYILRSLTIIAIIYTLAFSQFFDSSMPAEFRFYITVGTALAATLLGYRAGIIATISGAITILVLHFSIVRNPSLLPEIDLYQRSTNWLNGALLYTLLAAGVVFAISALINGLQSGLKQNEALANNLTRQRAILEETVQNRTADIQRRLTQVHTAAEISRAISRLRDPATLFPQVTELIRERFGLYYVGIFTIDPSGRYALLSAGTGDAGRAMLEQGHRLSVGGNSMIGWCVANRQPRIALDVGDEAVRFSNPFLPRTRSEVALPILSQSEVLGAMTFQSTDSKAFDPNDLVVLQGISDSLAVAMDNANLFDELNQHLEEIDTLNRNYLKQAWSQVVSNEGEYSFEYQGLGISNIRSSGTAVKIPLLLRGQAIGEVMLDIEGDHLSQEDQTYLESLTTQTAIALENARLVQESEWRVFQERKLNEMASELYRSATLDGILKTAIEQLGQLPNVSEVSIQLATPEALSLHSSGGNGKEHRE